MRRSDTYLLAGAAVAAYVWFSSQPRGRTISQQPYVYTNQPGPASVSEIIGAIGGLIRLAQPQPAAQSYDPTIGLPSNWQFDTEGWQDIIDIRTSGQAGGYI